MNKLEAKDKEISSLRSHLDGKNQKIHSLQTQLIGNQTIINNLQRELNNANAQLDSWQSNFFLPQFSWNQPDSAITFRTQINSFDVAGTAGLCYLLYKGYRKYKSSREHVADNNEEQRPLLSDENQNLKQQLANHKLENNKLQAQINRMREELENQQTQIIQAEPFFNFPSSSK